MQNVRSSKAKVFVEYDNYISQWALLFSVQAPYDRFYLLPFSRRRSSFLGQRGDDRGMLGMAWGRVHAVDRRTSIMLSTEDDAEGS